MTLQPERPLSPSDAKSWTRGARRARVAAAALVVAAAATGSAAYLAMARNDATPQVALGQSRDPLPIFRVDRLSEPRASALAGAGERLVPVLGRPGQVVVIPKQPEQLLHVRYVHVRMGTAPQLELAAPGEESFHSSRRGEVHYVAVVDGHAAALLFVFGSSDQTNFAIGGGLNPISRAQALTIADQLATSVDADE